MPQHDRLKDEITPDRVHRAPAKPSEHEAGAEHESHPLLGLQGLVGNDAVRALVADEGAPLTEERRHDMERSFGRSFGDVRIHEGGEVDRAANEIDAAAFTVGADVFIHSAAPDLETAAGQELLAEELAHVAQGVGDGRSAGLTDPDGMVEAEARAAASDALAGERAHVTAPAAGAAVARKRFNPDEWVTPEEKRLMDPRTRQERIASESEEAQQRERTQELSEEARNRLKSGSVPKLETAATRLEGDPSRRDLAQVLALITPIPEFIASFGSSASDAQVPILIQQFIAVEGAKNAIAGLVNPAGTIARMASELTRIAGIGHVMAASARDVAPNADGTPGVQTTLTTALGRQMASGVVTPIRQAVAALRAQPADVEQALDHLMGVRETVEGFGGEAPNQLADELAEMAANLQIVNNELETLTMSKEEVLNQTKDDLKAAALAITALAEGGAAAEEPLPPAPSPNPLPPPPPPP